MIQHAFDVAEDSWAYITWAIAIFVGLDYLGNRLRRVNKWLRVSLVAGIAVSGVVVVYVFSQPWIVALLVPTALTVVVALAAALLSGSVEIDA
ncbi:MAG TPA: hypothetical protein VHT23_10390 [Gemmatimonadaceae bacterium]|jgi:uncharacterized membrane protein YccC|nr:hypothetical protein [Gemmatimonadaceae bacterium]